MSDFFVGQKVVCVDDQNWLGLFGGKATGRVPVKGGIYTIRRLGLKAVNGQPALTLAEFDGVNVVYLTSRFKPLEEKPESIELFRTIGTKPIIPDDAPSQEPKRHLPQTVPSGGWPWS